MPIDLTFCIGFGLIARSGWDAPAEPASEVNVLRRAVELGVTFSDMSDSHGLGRTRR